MDRAEAEVRAWHEWYRKAPGDPRDIPAPRRAALTERVFIRVSNAMPRGWRIRRFHAHIQHVFDGTHRTLADYRIRVLLGEQRYEECLREISLFGREKRCAGALARALAGAGQSERALEVARTAAGRKDCDAALVLGEMLAERGQHDEVIVWFGRAAKCHSVACGAEREMAQLLLALGDYRDAATALENAIRWSPFRRDDDVKLLHECLRRCGRDRDADAVEQFMAATAVSTQIAELRKQETGHATRS